MVFECSQAGNYGVLLLVSTHVCSLDEDLPVCSGSEGVQGVLVVACHHRDRVAISPSYPKRLDASWRYIDHLNFCFANIKLN